MTIQLYPELSKGNALQIYKSRGDTLGEPLLDRAIKTLEKPTHSSVITQWFLRFIEFRELDAIS